MKKLLLVGFIAATFTVFDHEQFANPQQNEGVRAASSSAQLELLNQYCITCHNDRARTASLSLENVDLSHVAKDAELWEKVIRKVRAGMMPPSGARRPDNARLDALAAWLENEIDSVGLASPALVRPGVHRLNQAEYANSIREILGLEIDARKFLPVDDSEQGFDNVASSLNMSTALLEAYVSAAGKLSRLALGRETAPGQWIYPAPQDLSQEVHIEGMPFGTRGGIRFQHFFPADGEYAFTWAPVRGNTGQLFGHLRTKELLEFAIDGERIHAVQWGNVTPGIDDDDIRNLFRVSVKAGLRTVEAYFLATTHVPIDDLNKHPMRSVVDTTPLAGFTWSPQLSRVTILGPFNAVEATHLPSRQKILTCSPQTASEEISCAQKILSKAAGTAFRRPAVDQDLEALTGFFEDGRRAGGFEYGIELGLRRILADPEFIFRTEAEPANVKPGEAYRISDLDLASRLSFFLWSAPPDDELVGLAAQRRLSDPQVLAQQVQRMLKDSRSNQMIVNFVGQWLQLRNLASTAPAVQIFPDFDDNLRQAFRRETEMFFESIVRENRSALDLLSADYTFVNDRVARHYGIPNIYGSHFQRVTLGPQLDVRRGLLGKGAIQLLTSLSDRTSPVQRGKWVLMNILGTIPPEPPPAVPELKRGAAKANGQEVAVEETMRQRMQEHRTNPTCSSCHKIMDPIGFALENFDAVGKFRTGEWGQVLNVRDELVDGTVIEGPAGLRQALLAKGPLFVQSLTEKLMVYALGRSVHYYDQPVVRAIVRDAARDNYRFQSLIMGVVNSEPFQRNRKEQLTAER